MRWTFDIDAAAMYIFLTDHDVDRQVELPDGIIVDLDGAGAPVGVEILNPHPTQSVLRLSELGVGDEELGLIRRLTETAFPSFVHGGVAVRPQPSLAELEECDVFEQEIALPA